MTKKCPLKVILAYSPIVLGELSSSIFWLTPAAFLAFEMVDDSMRHEYDCNKEKMFLISDGPFG